MSTDLIFYGVDVPKKLNVMMLQEDSFFIDQDVNTNKVNAIKI